MSRSDINQHINDYDTSANNPTKNYETENSELFRKEVPHNVAPKVHHSSYPSTQNSGKEPITLMDKQQSQPQPSTTVPHPDQAKEDAQRKEANKKSQNNAGQSK